MQSREKNRIIFESRLLETEKMNWLHLTDGRVAGEATWPRVRDRATSFLFLCEAHISLP